MATTNGGPGGAPTNGGPAAQPNAEPAVPQLQTLTQYIKDFSFENPNAPASLQQQPHPPKINIQINVNAKPLAPNDFEVELKLEGRAEMPNLFLFSFDLLFAGLFRFVNVPQESIQPAVMIECPRLLFPFAREIIATAVRQGGFPPLVLDPVDFAQLYRQRMGELQPQPGAPTA